MVKIWGAIRPPVKKHPRVSPEDYFAFNELTFCVADGITRDPLIPVDWTDVKMEDALVHYPNPSPATAAAKLTTDSFIEAAQAFPARGALVEANNKVAGLNKNLTCDYLRNDFAACVAVGGKIEGDQLHWASIGDCQVAVFNTDGARKFLSPNGLDNFSREIQKNPGNWRDPARRVEVRRDFRNNPDNSAAFGALTGESTAEHFMMSGHEQLEEGDTVIAFSDGFAPTVQHPDFWANFQKSRDAFLTWELTLAQDDPDQFGHERTILVVGSEGFEPATPSV